MLQDEVHPSAAWCGTAAAAYAEVCLSMSLPSQAQGNPARCSQAPLPHQAPSSFGTTWATRDVKTCEASVKDMAGPDMGAFGGRDTYCSRVGQA